VKQWKIPLATGALALVLVTVTWLFLSRSGPQIDEQQAEQALRSGIDLFGQRDYEAAIESLGRVPEGSQFESTAKYYEGSSQLMMRNVDAAIDILQQAHLLAPEDPHILYALGVASFRTGNMKLAKGYFTSVLNIPPVDENDREMHKQAKGLMDTLAVMERRQAEQGEGQPSSADVDEDPQSPAQAGSTPDGGDPGGTGD
jgi:tetratricopeptide (TPR) repeat protein